MLLAVDPGPTLTAFVVLDDLGVILDHGHVPSAEVLEKVRAHPGPIAIEMIACYGMPVGREVFETCLWIGRMIEAARHTPYCVYRQDVKLHLCRSARANDSTIRQALLDRYGPGKAAVGTKAQPGPCYGISGDKWAALAVGVTFQDQSDKFHPFFCPESET
jgi:hypothetical protein